MHLQIHKNHLAIDCGNGFIFCTLLDSITNSVISNNPTIMTKFTKKILVRFCDNHDLLVDILVVNKYSPLISVVLIANSLNTIILNN